MCISPVSNRAISGSREGDFCALIALLLAIALALLLSTTSATAQTSRLPIRPFESDKSAHSTNKIDQLVLFNLQRLGIVPSPLCSDEVFLRRAYLDVIGTLPTWYETRDFLLSGDREKRRHLIDRLLERDEFADYWAMKWSDLLRVKAEFPINLWPNATQAYYRWIRTSIKENKPYDVFVRELLTSSGSNFREAPVNFYRAMQNHQPDGIAQTVALTFMGARAEKWPTNRLVGMAAFFARVGYKATGEWKEEIILDDRSKSNAPTTATFPDGTTVQLSLERDPRQQFADWLVNASNPWFTRNIANRTWSWFLGRGVINEPDDIRPDNLPTNPELLDYLEAKLVASRYNLKELMREILNSRTYQSSSIPADTNTEAAANFACYTVRRVEAEVLIDAIDQITATTERYTSAIPEPFTYIPENHRSVALPDGSISSSFLEMFGRPPRDTGLESERNNRSTANQSLHLLNSSHILNKIEQSRIVNFNANQKATAQQLANGVFMSVLSRFPTVDEQNTTVAYFKNKSERSAKIDLLWALLNSPEFLYRH
jgi:hypothetical protein